MAAECREELPAAVLGIAARIPHQGERHNPKAGGARKTAIRQAEDLVGEGQLVVCREFTNRMLKREARFQRQEAALEDLKVSLYAFRTRAVEIIRDVLHRYTRTWGKFLEQKNSFSLIRGNWLWSKYQTPDEYEAHMRHLHRAMLQAKTEKDIQNAPLVYRFAAKLATRARSSDVAAAV